MMKKNQLIGAGGFVLCCFIPVIFASQSYVITLLNFICIYALAASGLDLLFGYSGQISLGHAGFYAIGAYTSALLSMHLGIPPLLTMVVGALLAAGVGIVLAYPASKLKYHFLSLTTIAFGEIIYLVAVYSPGDITQGFSGLSGIPAISFFGYRVTKARDFFYVALVLLAVFLLVKQCIVNSKIGRAFIAIRDNSHAADGMGINVRKYRIMAFAISAFYTGFAGALYAHMIRFISPETFTMDNMSVLLLTIVLFGGLASTGGPLIGAVVITVIKELLQSTGNYQMIIYSIFIVVVLLFMPRGIVQFFVDLKNKFLWKGAGANAANQ